MPQFPVAIVSGGLILAAYFGPQAFVGPGGLQHPAGAWEHWSPADWADKCPGWSVRPLIDAPPAIAGKRAVQRPMEDWTIAADAVTVAYDTVDLTPAEISAAGAMLQRQVGEAVQRHLDATVQARGYESIHTCVTYADEPAVPRFQAEGQAARAWRSAVWAQCYAVLDEVLSGERVPLTPAEMVAELPALVWPD